MTADLTLIYPTLTLRYSDRKVGKPCNLPCCSLLWTRYVIYSLDYFPRQVDNIHWYQKTFIDYQKITVLFISINYKFFLSFLYFFNGNLRYLKSPFNSRMLAVKYTRYLYRCFYYSCIRAFNPRLDSWNSVFACHSIVNL